MALRASKWAWVAGAILVLALIFAGYKACNLYDGLSVQKGRYEAYRAIATATRGALEERLRAAATALAEQNAALERLRVDAVERDRAMAAQGAELERLRAEEPQAPPEVEAHPLVVNLRAQLAALSGQFSLAQSAIRNRDEQIAVLTARADTLARVAADWRNAYEQEHRLRLLADELMKDIEGRQRVLRFKSSLKTAAIAVAGGFALYQTVKK